ncbi:MAG: ABC transporter substrate-binding protein [Chloroflexi bacterium]|nr:ABC transporter substrate-binding protein [Chloroflexota bacterium]MBV9895380.1 ABC transporter substrate-binding protein [Chloroflexota bacterium]
MAIAEQFLTGRVVLPTLAACCLVLAACQSQPPAAAPTTGAPAAPTSASGAPAATSAVTAASKPAQQGGTLTIGLDQEPPTMDPEASPSAITFFITSSVGETLLYIDENRKIQPWLAQSYEVSSDAKTFTFHLRNDVTFQDGTPFNASAVKWNFDRVVDPNYKAGSALPQLTGYQGTDTPDDYTAVVHFKDPFVPFLIYAGSPYLPMVSPTAAQKQADQVNQTPVMSGPYKIDEWVPKDHVTISRWDGYKRKAPWSDHDGAGYLDQVIWKFVPEAGTRSATVESGETQAADILTPQDVPRLQSEGMQIVSKAWVGMPEMMFLTTTQAPTDDVNVRQAVEYGIDRDALVSTLYQGIGQKAIGPLTAIMLDDPSLRAMYPHDIAKAGQLLDQSGWTAGADGIRTKNGQRLTFSLNAIDYGSGPLQDNELIQGQLRQIGMDVSIKAQARPPWYEDNYHCANNGMELFLRSGELDVLDAAFDSTNVGGNFNWSCLKDPEVDSMLHQGRQETDPAKRQQLYLQLEQKLMNQAVIVPLVDQLSVFALRPGVSGMKFTGNSYPLVTDITLSK